MLKIDILPALKDNYIFFLEDEATGLCACVDPGEAKPVIDFIDANDKKLDFILNTHHHWDHTNGNKKLKENYGAKIVAFKGDAHRIEDIDIEVEEGTAFKVGESEAEIFEVPGHTTGHIAFHFPASLALFSGDTLFSLGCGRLFEGTPEQMWNSLKKLRDLPENTQIYCGHEYTYDNGGFCLTIERDNIALQRRLMGVKRLRDNNRPTVPSLMGMERQTNVFLRADHFDLIKELPFTAGADDPVKVFTYLRELKDAFG